MWAEAIRTKKDGGFGRLLSMLGREKMTFTQSNRENPEKGQREYTRIRYSFILWNSSGTSLLLCVKRSH